jgi:hypothetical protein
MPFTFAHPAIVLPLSKLSPRYLSITALVIGSIVPDFEYFLRLQIKSTLSHTLPGIFYFDLPLTLGLAYVFHLVIRKPLLAHLPLEWQNRMAPCVNFNWVNYSWKHASIIILSALLGISSHLLWDSFTHSSGYFATIIPVLRTEVYLLGYTFPVYKYLQHMSTIIGFLVIGTFGYKLPNLFSEKMPFILYYWPVVVFITSGFILFSVYNSFQLGQTIVNGISGLLAGILIASLLVRKYYL